MSERDRNQNSVDPEEVNRHVRAGGSVYLHDPRVTRATNWVLGLVGTGLLGFLFSIDAQIGAMRDQMATYREQNAALLAEFRYQQQINQAQDSRLNIYDDRLRAVERAEK